MIFFICFTFCLYELASCQNIPLDLPLPPLPPNPEREAALKLREMREPWIIKPPPNPAPYPLFDPNLSPWGNWDEIPQLPFNIMDEYYSKGLPNGDGIFFNNKRIDEGRNNYIPYRNWVANGRKK